MTVLEMVPAISHLVSAIPLDVHQLVSMDMPGNPTSTAPPGSQGIEKIMGWVKWVALAVCIMGLIAAGAMMAINSRRGEGGEHVGRIAMALGGVIVISAAGSVLGFLAS